MTGSAREAALDLRLRVASPGLLSLPWEDPLAEWDATEVPLRDIPVGPSRHLVRFVETDGRVWALKELPRRVAAREYAVLRGLEQRELPAVRPAGVVLRGDEDNAVLVTHYLERSWQYRRLFLRIPPNMVKHRARLLDAMATLLVDLHRHGVYWGDCSLANTLFTRDGQVVQAWLVDAETSEIHPSLSDGQRRQDIDVLIQNVAGGMLDLATRLGRPPELFPTLLEEAASVATRYEALWEVLHRQPTFPARDRYRVESQVRELQDLGFTVDEVQLQPSSTGDDELRLRVAVASRRFHAAQLQRLVGMDVGEGQARILLGDLRAFQAEEQRRAGRDVPDEEAALAWAATVLRPGMARAHEAVNGIGDPVQAYCDLLEVRWLLSEQAGRDVGDDVALAALAERSAPVDSVARMGVAEVTTGQLPVLSPEARRDWLDDLDVDPPQ